MLLDFYEGGQLSFYNTARTNSTPPVPKYGM